MTKKNSINNTEFENPEDWHRFSAYLINKNRFILTDYLDKFIDSLMQSCDKRMAKLDKGSKLFRARIGSHWTVFEDGDEQPYPFYPTEMGPPPKNEARAGRINSEGIPCLYLSTSKSTAIAEVRPYIGAEVSIGVFEILSDLAIVDTSNDKQENPLSLYTFEKKDGDDLKMVRRPNDSFTPDMKEEWIWGDINAAFSRPISPQDTTLWYLPTQYLAERMKLKGYDGIAYKSALSEKGYNIALFDPLKAICKLSQLYEVKHLTYDAEAMANPVGLSDKGEPLLTRITSFLPLEKKVKEV